MHSKAVQYMVSVLITLVVILASLYAPAQEMQETVTLRGNLNFISFYRSFVEGIPEEQFELCVRLGGEHCPPLRHLSADDVPRRLGHFRRLEHHGLPSPGNVAGSLLEAGALSARCYEERQGSDGITRLVSHRVALSVATIQAHPWNPRRWVRRCPRLSIVVLAGKSIEYSAVELAATRALRDATEKLSDAQTVEQAQAAAREGHQALLQEPAPSDGAASLFANALATKLAYALPLSTSAIPIVPASQGRVIPREVVATPPTTLDWVVRVTLLATLCCIGYLLRLLGRKQEEWQATLEERERIDKVELAKAEGEALERGRKEGWDRAAEDFKQVRTAARFLVERLFNLLEDADFPNGKMADFRKDRVAGNEYNLFLALSNAVTALPMVCAKAQKEGARREREAHQSVANGLKVSLVEALHKLGLEVPNPSADVVALVVATFERWRSTRAQEAATQPRTTLDYAAPKVRATPPTPPVEAIHTFVSRPLQLAILAMRVLNLGDPEAAKSATVRSPKLPELATAALDRLVEGFEIRRDEMMAHYDVWVRWADQLQSHLDHWMYVAETALASLAPAASADEKPDVGSKANRFSALLERMSERVRELAQADKYLDTVLSDGSLGKGGDVPFLLKLGIAVGGLQAAHDTSGESLQLSLPLFSQPPTNTTN